MKKLITILFVLFFAGSMYSCNAFDWMDPNINALDRCQSLNDSGDFAGAIEACNDADPEGTNVDAQIELADASLGALGINIQTLSQIFLNKSGGTITIVDLAESLIKKSMINKENAEQSKKYAQKSVDAMDRYGALIGNTLQDKQVAVFYSLLARVCQVAVLMAYADIESATPDGKVTRDDICNPDQPNCAAGAANICNGVACEGMHSSDAGVAFVSMLNLVILLDTPASEGGLPSGIDIGAIDAMLDISFVDGGVSYNIRTAPGLIPSAIRDDAGRKVLLEMARTN